MHHGGAHGEEGEDEGDEGLSLSDQVPVGTNGGGVVVSVEQGIVGGVRG